MKKRIKKLKKKLKKCLVRLESLRDAFGARPRSEEKAGKEAWTEIGAQHADADAAADGMRGTLDETIKTLSTFRASLYRSPLPN